MKIESIVKTSENRYLPRGTLIIKDLTSKMSLPKVITDDAIWIYKKVVTHNIRSKSTKKMMTACIYAAIRRSPVTSRTLNELARVSNEKKVDIQRSYRIILSEIEIKPGIPDPEQKISKIINGLHLSPIKTELISRISHKILNRAKKSKKRYGKNPNGLAAAAVYLACKEKKIKRTQKEIAVLSSITELILRQRKDELKKIL